MLWNNHDKHILTNIYEKIKIRILSFAYAPGSYVNEEYLEKEFSDSRDYFQYAINWLEMEEWLIREPDKRLRVKDITVKDILEIYQIRKLIEVPALQEIFTEERTDEYADRLGALVAKVKEVKNDNFTREMTESYMHMEIANIFNNSHINRIYRRIQDKCVRFCVQFLINDKNSNIEGFLHTLDEFVDAIRAKNFDKSLELLYKNHLEGGLIRALMSNQTIKQ
jgi:DNA-binding GntR family transcriptional regulator